MDSGGQEPGIRIGSLAKYGAPAGQLGSECSRVPQDLDQPALPEAGQREAEVAEVFLEGG